MQPSGCISLKLGARSGRLWVATPKMRWDVWETRAPDILSLPPDLSGYAQHGHGSKPTEDAQGVVAVRPAPTGGLQR